MQFGVNKRTCKSVKDGLVQFCCLWKFLVFINIKLHSKSCRYLNLYDVLRTYSFPVARGIFSGIDLSCFVPQSADTKFFMLPLRTLHWHCWGHSDKQKQASIKNWYLNHICFNRYLVFKDTINWTDVETSTKDDFESELYLIEVFVFYV